MTVSAHNLSKLWVDVSPQPGRTPVRVDNLDRINHTLFHQLAFRYGIALQLSVFVCLKQSFDRVDMGWNTEPAACANFPCNFNRGFIRTDLGIAFGATEAAFGQQIGNRFGCRAGAEQAKDVNPGVNGDLDSGKQVQLAKPVRLLVPQFVVFAFKSVDPAAAVVICDRNTINPSFHVFPQPIFWPQDFVPRQSMPDRIG